MSATTTTYRPGDRVAVTQPKWPEFPANTETTTHFGVVEPGPLLPGDDRVPVRIDSGAVILYPARHVFEAPDGA